jgi:hypothetical protein
MTLATSTDGQTGPRECGATRIRDGFEDEPRLAERCRGEPRSHEISQESCQAWGAIVPHDRYRAFDPWTCGRQDGALVRLLDLPAQLYHWQNLTWRWLR